MTTTRKRLEIADPKRASTKLTDDKVKGKKDQQEVVSVISSTRLFLFRFVLFFVFLFVLFFFFLPRKI